MAEIIGNTGGTLSGTNNDDIFRLNFPFAHDADGLDGNDIFTFGNQFTAADTVDGGTGFDQIVLGGNYTGAHAVSFADDTMVNVEVIRLRVGRSYDLTTADANVAAGESLRVDASLLGSTDSATFDGSAETDGTFRLIGGAGDDDLTGGAGADTLDLRLGGNDVATGGDGDDYLRFGDSFDANDDVDGGVGDDRIQLDGDYSGGVTFASGTLVGVETILLAAGHDYSLTTDDSTVAAGERLTVTARLGSFNQLTFNGAAETNGAFNVTGGAGNDTITGGAGNDGFNLTRGGMDTAHGGGGRDTFRMGATLDFGDTIDGGDGNDALRLEGDYGGPGFGFNFAGVTVTDVETLILDGTNDYYLSIDSGTVPAGERLKVVVSGATMFDFEQVDGKFATDAAFDFVAGQGRPDFTGANGDDTFDLRTAFSPKGTGNGGDDLFIVGSFGAEIDGGNGNDTLRYDGDVTSATLFGGSMVQSIETLEFAAGHSYADVNILGNISGISRLTVDAASLGAGDSLDIDLGGATSFGYDVTGGAGDDSFAFSDNLASPDTIDGGAGFDEVSLNGNYGDFSLPFAFPFSLNEAHFAGIESLKLAGFHSYNFNYSASSAQLAVDASALNAPDKFAFDGSSTGATFTFTGGASDDTFTGGSGNDNIMGGGGADILDGRGGADIFVYTAASQSTGTTRDTVRFFNAAEDFFDFDRTVSQIQNMSGTVNSPTFNGDLQALIDDGIAAQSAVVVSVTGGDLAGKTLLVLAVGGFYNFGASPATDYVVDISGFSGTLTTSNFI